MISLFVFNLVKGFLNEYLHRSDLHNNAVDSPSRPTTLIVDPTRALIMTT
jgi:hypothetical protein